MVNGLTKFSALSALRGGHAAGGALAFYTVTERRPTEPGSEWSALYGTLILVRDLISNVQRNNHAADQARLGNHYLIKKELPLRSSSELLAA